MKQILPNDLICMNDFADCYHYRVDLAYARDDNLLFNERIYRQDASLWLHRDLAKIVKKAAFRCFEMHNLRFVLYDGLRTVDAQKAMMQTQRVKDNPHWLEAPRLLSSPGGGGHPRGMAIDIGLETLAGELIDMGCAFDDLVEDSSPTYNRAHRHYQHAPHIVKNRSVLDSAMIHAAKDLNAWLVPLAEEWWDFRLPHDVFMAYAPLSEQDLEPKQCMMNP